MSQRVLREAGQISSSTIAMFHAIGHLGVLPIVEIFIRQCRELKTVGREMCGERTRGRGKKNRVAKEKKK